MKATINGVTYDTEVSRQQNNEPPQYFRLTTNAAGKTILVPTNAPPRARTQ